MLRGSENPLPSDTYPADICLLLRAHGEQHWLTCEVLPVLRQAERPQTLPEEQLAAALAYLEVLWLDAQRHAAETDAALAELLEDDPHEQRPFHLHSRRYERAVHKLRDEVGERVRRATAPPPQDSGRREHATA
jgi:hypothetical protein